MPAAPFCMPRWPRLSCCAVAGSLRGLACGRLPGHCRLGRGRCSDGMAGSDTGGRRLARGGPLGCLVRLHPAPVPPLRRRPPAASPGVHDDGSARPAAGRRPAADRCAVEPVRRLAMVGRHRDPTWLRGLQHPVAREPLLQHTERCALAYQSALRRARRTVPVRPRALRGCRAVPPRLGDAVRRPRQRRGDRRTADRHRRRTRPALVDSTFTSRATSCSTPRPWW